MKRISILCILLLCFSSVCGMTLEELSRVCQKSSPKTVKIKVLKPAVTYRLQPIDSPVPTMTPIPATAKKSPFVLHEVPNTISKTTAKKTVEMVASIDTAETVLLPSVATTTTARRAVEVVASVDTTNVGPAVSATTTNAAEVEVAVSQETATNRHSLKNIERNVYVGGFVNGLAEGASVSGEVFGWLEGGQGDIGGGVFVSADVGKASLYEWRNFSLGPQIGLQCLSIDSQGLVTQEQIKLRLLWEKMHGSSSDGYWMDGTFIKPNVYAQLVKDTGPRSKIIIQGEAMFGFNQTFKSSWSGDKAPNRTMLSLAIYGQYAIDSNWAVRYGPALIYTGWDKIFWVDPMVQFRYKERFVIGPNIRLPIGKLRGVPWKKLVTPGAIIGYEAGDDVRRMQAVADSKMVQPAQKPAEGIIKKPF